MLRSLFSSISGLRSHQTMMDVTGNNIANVNTAGFKSSNTVFQDTLSQLIKGAGASQGGNGGTSPSQVGLGVRIASVNTNFGQGSAQTTGRSTDLMIQGDGFFVVRDEGQTLFTRAGSFGFDAEGRLTTPDGAVVQGWTGNNGVIDTNAPVGDIVLPINAVLEPVETTTAAFGGNLPMDALTGTVITTSIKTYDATGQEETMTVSFTKDAAAGVWNLSSPTGTMTEPTVDFSASGGATPDPTMLTYTDATGAVIDIDISTMTGFSGTTSVAAQSQNGSQMGTLQAFAMSPTGTLVGVFSNGMKQDVAQLGVALFNNPQGLEKEGGSNFSTSVVSGLPQIAPPGVGARGSMSSGMLEMSNVDLAAEFTNLIIAQRGFQANSRVITTSDSILEDLVNLKR